MSFARKLEYGQVGESVIALWLRSRGWSVLPVYDVEYQTGKGPRVFGPQETLIAPDVLAFRASDTVWIEAKHKTAFSWYRKKRQWVTGIDLCHYADYCRVADESPWPVWLMFLHRGGRAKDTPAYLGDSPAGLFGRELSFLRQEGNQSHISPEWGKGGMIYWPHENLHLLSSLPDLGLA